MDEILLEEAELEYEHKKSESAVLPHEYEDLQQEVDILKNDLLLFYERPVRKRVVGARNAKWC